MYLMSNIQDFLAMCSEGTGIIRMSACACQNVNTSPSASLSTSESVPV